MEKKIFKTTSVELNSGSVVIRFQFPDRDDRIIELPTDLIPAELSLQFAGAVAACPKLPVSNETNTQNN